MKLNWKPPSHFFAMPFAQPKIGVLYALFAGIILGFGTDFVFSIFKEDKIASWEMRQWAGLCFIASAIMLSLIAFLLQYFNDFLVKQEKDEQDTSEKREQFEIGDWGGRSYTQAAFTMFWVFFLTAIVFLVLAYRNAGLASPAPSA